MSKFHYLSQRFLLQCTTESSWHCILLCFFYYRRCSFEVNPYSLTYFVSSSKPKQKRQITHQGRETRLALEWPVCLFCRKQLTDCLFKQRNEMVMFSLCSTLPLRKLNPDLTTVPGISSPSSPLLTSFLTPFTKSKG